MRNLVNMPLKSLLNYRSDIPMTQYQTHIMMNLMMAEQQEGDDPKLDEVLQSDHMSMIIQDRLDRANVEYSKHLVIFAAWQCKGSPGKGVMWAYAICHLFHTMGKKAMLGDICYYCPMGFPTEAQQNECWDAQKQRGSRIGTDNKLDEVEYWYPSESEDAPNPSTECDASASASSEERKGVRVSEVTQKDLDNNPHTLF